FGKITNHYYGYEQIIYQGVLQWQIQGPNEMYTFSTDLESLSNGNFSYALKIPEKALIDIPQHIEYESQQNDLLLTQTDIQYDHIQITVNGLNARIKEPKKAHMMASQRKRGQVLQFDLEITDPPKDADNDGIPDFWEDLYGLNKNQPDDAFLDSDNDGWNNLEEFQHMSHPDFNNTIPGMDKASLIHYGSESGKTMLSLNIKDSDTLAESLHMSLIQPPACGNLIFKGNTNQPLAVNDQISARQIQEGWVYYEHLNAACLEDQFMIHLWDAESVNAPLEYTIHIQIQTLVDVNIIVSNIEQSIYQIFEDLVFLGTELSTSEIWREAAKFASKGMDYVIADFSDNTGNVNITAPSGKFVRNDYQDFTNQYGQDESYILMGGMLNDVITGSHENDILISGPGTDILKGNSGADIFVVQDSNQILDFTPQENDIIDLCLLLNGSSKSLDDYLQISNDGIHTTLKIATQGDQIFNQEIELSNIVLDTEDIHTLWAKGQLKTGRVRPDFNISIQAMSENAVETLAAEGKAVISFSHEFIPQGLQIPMKLSGVAKHETDYLLQARLYNETTNAYEYVDISSVIPVQLESGDQQLEIRLIPVADHIQETTENVIIQLLENESMYSIENNSVSISISDGPDILSIEKTANEILEDNQRTESFIVKRLGSIDSLLDISLKLMGTARNGEDYQYIPPEWTFSSGQDRLEIAIVPNMDALLELPSESIELVILPSENYQTDKNRETMLIKEIPIEMTLSTSNAVAERNWNIPAIVNIKSSSMIQSDISVSLKFRGTAINGRDMEWLSDTIIFGAGLTSFPISIHPKQSSDAAIKKLEIEIIPMSPYICGAQSKAEIYIANEKQDVKDFNNDSLTDVIILLRMN
ncbi:MAG: type I secretion C-terminal target domain-containing protein, partial [Candidatus Magnetomorum sp.]|nr:type I secretion C-terminal target domain-containing protein [Candidatus Magnetomorum sp.]